MTCENSNVDITLAVYLSGSFPPPHSCLQRCLRQATPYSNLFWHSVRHSFWHLSRWNIFWHSFWHRFGHLPWHSAWHSFWHLLWNSFRHLSGHSVWHSFWGFWHSFWHLSWHSFWHLFWHSFCRSGRQRTLAQMIAVEVRQRRLGAADRGWSPAANTGRRWSRLRSTSEHWMQMLAGARTHEEKQKEKEEKEEKEAMTSHRSKQPSPDRWNCYC